MSLGISPLQIKINVLTSEVYIFLFHYFLVSLVLHIFNFY